MKKLVGIIVVALSVFVISCQKDQDLFVESELLSEKSAQIMVNEISVDNAMADINFESDFFISAEQAKQEHAQCLDGLLSKAIAVIGSTPKQNDSAHRLPGPPDSSTPNPFEL